MAAAEAQKTKDDDDIPQDLHHAEDYVDDIAFLEKKPPKLNFFDKTPAYLRQITYKSIFVSFDFLKAVRPSTENCILSPIGLSAPLSVLGAGADFSTEQEIKDAMLWELVPWNHCVYYFYWVMSIFQLNRRLAPNTLFFSVHVFVKLNSNLNAHFQETIGKIQKFQVVQIVPTLNGYETKINKAFASYTCGNCTEVVPLNTFDDHTQAVMVSVCYIKPIWRMPFQERFTCLMPFHLNKTEQRKVFTMKHHDLFKYNENMDMQLLGMYLKAGRYVLYFVLPKQKFGLSRLENKVFKTSTKLEKLFELIEKAAQNDVIVEIPRFKFLLSQDITKRLKLLNLVNMFDPDFAEFSKLCDKEAIHVDYVYQTIGLEITEMGLPGDGFDGPLNDRLEYNPYEHPPFMLPKKFICNHPFLVLLLDRESSAVFQFGRIVDPTEQGAGIILNY